MLPTDICEDDACRPAPYEVIGPQHLSGIIFSLLPFIFTFLIVSIGVQQKLFPLLSGQHPKSDDHLDASPSTRQIHTVYGSKSLRHRIAAISFSTTIALAAVLAELILCEISNTVNPAARTVAWKFTVRTLLFLLIILIP